MITTWNPDDVVLAVTAVMTGTAGAIWIVWVTGAGMAAPPASFQVAVSVMVPATVPVCSKIGTVVLPEAIGRLVVPFENRMDGSTAGEANDASGWKASVTVPVIPGGYPALSANEPLSCWSEVAVLDSPLKLAPITVSVKAAEAVVLALPVT